MIDITPEQLAEVRRLLRQHMPDAEVRAFGSRVSGKSDRRSDLDLAVVGVCVIDLRRIEALKDAFAESDLPFMVDVVDWNAVSEGFRGVIDRGYEVVGGE